MNKTENIKYQYLLQYIVEQIAWLPGACLTDYESMESVISIANNVCDLVSQMQSGEFDSLDVFSPYRFKDDTKETDQ